MWILVGEKPNIEIEKIPSDTWEDERFNRKMRSKKFHGCWGRLEYAEAWRDFYNGLIDLGTLYKRLNILGGNKNTETTTMRIISKEDLQDKAWYQGYCRNALMAQWDGKTETFVITRWKYGFPFTEAVKHINDERGNADAFVPIKWVEPLNRAHVDRLLNDVYHF